MWDAIGQWSHALAAALFLALAIWQAGRRDGERRRLLLAIAFAATAAWAALASSLGPEAAGARIAETMRNLCYLGFMFGLQRGVRADDERRRFVGLVYAALAAVCALQLVPDLIPGLHEFGREGQVVMFFSTTALRMTFAIGALVLVHNLYTAAAPEARWGLRLPMIALGAVWAYDLNLYTAAYLTQTVPHELLALRGVVAALLVPFFALAGRRGGDWKMQVSRTIAFQSLSLIAIGLYFIVMVGAVRAAEAMGTSYAPVAQVVLVASMSAAGLLLLPSRRLRAWLRVKIAKHFFQHRYDYRAEWIRFNRTLGRQGQDAPPLDQRIVQAIAEIAEAPAGALLVADGGDGLRQAAHWSWPTAEFGHHDNLSGFIVLLEETGHIVELDLLRRGAGDEAVRAATPAWLLGERQLWVLVPLIHNARLVGAVLLCPPPGERRLDWEDYDLFRIAGRQVASYLAEARGQEALSEARRFDEFNRRFAFIMHDIKNLVSQLSLVARNAERHADNPEFRADMIATLQDSVGKMNDLLARLSRHGRRRAEEPRPIGLRAIVGAVVAEKSPAHPIEIETGADVRAIADPARLEAVLGHIVQNAVDASPPGATVWVGVQRRGMQAAITVLDHGVGMTAEFIRSGLFKPFASSKEGGFGIGAFEARALVAEMNGRIEVESRPGEGSRFTILLPIAGADAVALFDDRPPLVESETRRRA